MLSQALRGAIAGATGTMALDITTYGDMLLRGRPASDVPAKAAGALADRLGIPALATSARGERAESRRSAMGALLGYATGLGIGGAYGLLRNRGGEVRTPLAGVAIGLVAMLAGDVPGALTGATDPGDWTAADWASTVIPHLVYGLVTAATYEAIASGNVA